MRRFVAFIMIAGLSGCAGWQEGVVKQAAFDHRCAAESIQIVANTDDATSRTVDLKVCGKERRYRDLGGAKITTWVDVTEGTPIPKAE